MRTIIAVFTGLLLAWTSGGVQAAGVELFVATDGNDAWSGKLAGPNDAKTDGPFRTLERAREAMRKQKATGGEAAQGGRVVVRGGFYALDKTFSLEAQDSGIAEAPVVYEAAPGEKVVLAGGPVVPTGAFAPVTDAKALERLDPAARGKVVQADLRAVGIAGLERFPVKFQGTPDAPELFFGEQRMTLARWPNHEWATIAKIVSPGAVPREGEKGTEGGVFEYSGDRPSRWNVEAGVWLHGYWAFDWYSEVIQVKSIDREKHQITLAAPSVYGVIQRNPSPRRYYALNLLEELDSPGEYFIDGTAGLLYFWPPAPLGDARVVVSTLKAPVLAVNEASGIRLRGFTVEASLSDGIQVTGGSDVRIQACEVRNTRGTGIRVSGGKGHAVEACDVHDTGTGGIVLAGGDRKTLTPAGHEAVNNHIWRFSIHKPTYSNALVLEGVGNRGAHNLIHDAPHQAIGVGGNDHVFEYNIVHHVCMETDDCGAFYKGRNPSCRGNMIRYNLWHNIGSPMGHGNAAIYFDDGDGGDIVFGNVFFRCGDPGKGSFGTVFSHGGHDILAENNIFVDCKRALGSAPWNDKRWKAALDGGEDCLWQERLLKEVDITKPPYTTHYPALVGFMNPQPGQPRVSRAVRNVLAMCADVKSGNWQLSPDENWVTDGDPGFVDAAQGDFRLKPDSEVFTKLPGFQPIPMEKMGLVQDELRPVVPREVWTYAAKALDKGELKKLRQEAAHRPRRVIYNDDGCHETPGTTAEAWLGCRVKQVVNTQVDTICYCTGGGGVFWAHQPKVGEVLGQWVEEGHDAYVKQMRDTLIALKKEGTDPLAVVVDYGHKNHMEVFWSCRMNNPECSFAPWGRSAKKRNNPALIMGVPEDWKKYPLTDARAWYTLSDYENPEVRDDLVATIEDVCQRYEIDGIELDFIRHPLFFRPNLEGEPAEPRQVAMMTDMVRRMRVVTERESLRRGRPILVTVRVPLSVESCMNIGLDIRTYLEEDLLDILIAGQDYIQMAVASSLKDMVDLGHQHHVPVYALLVPPKPYDRYRYDNRAWWGAAMNRWYWGADGIYLFNLFPSEPDERFSQLGSVETLKGRDKIYAIDNPAQEDVLGTFKMVMVGLDRLPITLTAQEATARLPVGEDIVTNTPPGKTVSTLLRLRLAGMAQGDTLQVAFNGHPLTVAGPVEPLAATPANAWFHIPTDPKLVKAGYNTIVLQLKTSRTGAAPVVVDALDLVVSYTDSATPSP
jgi:hypothetical protein